MPLTDPECKRAVCPADKPRLRLYDKDGLYLEVSAGSKRWFWKYRQRVGDKTVEKRLALGSYPKLPLVEARGKVADARQQHRTGVDPVHHKLATKAERALTSATTFEGVAREYHALMLASWSETHAAQWLRSLEKDLFPRIGALPLAEVPAPMLLAALKRVQDRGALVMAHDAREYAGQVFRYGKRTARCTDNPAVDLIGALKANSARNMAALTEPGPVGQLMRAIDAYTGQPITRAALQLSALLFQRPGNMRQMRWAAVDLDAALWTIPAADMKRKKDGKLNGRPHLVPMAPQAVAILRDVQALTGAGVWVFPSLLTGERAMSENTVNTALRRMGYSAEEHTAHGFRAMARTLLVERLDVDPVIVEAQLAHTKAGPLGEAYDRSSYMAQRRAMMARWADYLDELRNGAKVIPLRKA